MVKVGLKECLDLVLGEAVGREPGGDGDGDGYGDGDGDGNG